MNCLRSENIFGEGLRKRRLSGPPVQKPSAVIRVQRLSKQARSNLAQLFNPACVKWRELLFELAA